MRTRARRASLFRVGPLAWLAVLTLDAPLWAQGVFPRGPGYYFNPYNLGIFALVYFLWVRLTSWVDRDAQDLGLETGTWNSFMVGGGAAGLLALWIAPSFWIGFPIFIALFIASFGLYAYTRNQRVDKEERILTVKHLKKLATRYLRFKFGKESDQHRG